jgi:FemAB-related protein (PEP-CTERM system-associated)
LGYDAVCVYLYPEGDTGIESLKRRAKDANAEFIAIPDRGITDVRVIKQLATLCRNRNVSIWHGHDYKTDALGLLLRHRHPMKLVSTVHGWGVRSKKTPFYHAIDRAALRRYDRVICVSDALFSECMKARIPIDRCSEIANAIDLKHYETFDRPALRESWGLNNDRFVIGSLGRLSAEKGFDNLIDAANQLVESGVNAELLIGGDGPNRRQLAEQIEACEHSDRIRLVGHVEDPRSFLGALDAFAISSRSEGLPNVLLESLACGIPTVTTSVGGIPTVVEHERDALLVKPDDVEALTLAMSRLAHNPALTEQLSRNGRQTLAERFSFEVRMRKVAAVYDDVLGRTALPGRFSTVENEIADGHEPHNKPAEIDPDCFLAEPDYSSQNTGNPSSAVQTTLQVAEKKARARARVVSSKAVSTSQIQVEVTSTPGQWSDYLASRGYAGFHQREEWLRVLEQGLQHQTVCLQATSEDRIVGVLPLALVKSRLFGKFLVSLPYLNTSGIVADTKQAAHAIVDHAIQVAELTQVRYLELRHEEAIQHPQLTEAVTDKTHMRLELPATSEELWDGFKSKLRSQIRKPLANEGFELAWGGLELLDDFYSIFCRNMRDLGTPPFSRKLFAAILAEFENAAELCVVRLNAKPVASALLVHGPGVTEVPSASSLRQYNSSNANMLLYWNLLKRSIERGQSTFDFGRSSKDSGTFRFKAQWGAKASPAVWQHFVREGSATDMRPNSGKYDLMINTWQKLPVWITKIIGPSIVRGIP